MERACRAASPYRALQVIARDLAQDDKTHSKMWIVRASPGQASVPASDKTDMDAGNISAWPLWFRDGPEHVEIPLLYLLRSESVAGLRAAIYEAAERGIVCNDAEITTSRWPKSVQPAVPLWLANSLNGIPYDPASGQETLAILRSALQAMYVDDEPGFFYMTLHDDTGKVPASRQADVQEAYKGMYQLLAAPDSAIRLLGAGQALGNVVEAARRPARGLEYQQRGLELPQLYPSDTRSSGGGALEHAPSALQEKKQRIFRTALDRRHRPC